MSQGAIAKIEPHHTQWGEVLVAQDHIQSYREGNYGSGLPAKPAGRVIAGQNKNEPTRIKGDVGFILTEGETFSVWTEDIGGSTSTAQITVTWSETL